ncbi:unnamed protein product [Periconia digitata]|uniref:Uncharacterized protein n=1 Tax=Periconia digitata TaxID=1303443 RepID=A0A9W4XNT4_9PLEO|nr:unnamed protein product [Periconia digitata]
MLRRHRKASIAFAYLNVCLPPPLFLSFLNNTTRINLMPRFDATPCPNPPRNVANVAALEFIINHLALGLAFGGGYAPDVRPETGYVCRWGK